MNWIKCLPIFFLLVACSEPPAPKLRLNNRRIADSIYKEQIPMLTTEQDSLCKLLEEEHLDEVIDSILNLRRAKIKAQIQRSKKPTNEE